MGPGGPSQLRDSAGMVLAGRELHRLRYLRAVRHPSTAEPGRIRPEWIAARWLANFLLVEVFPVWQNAIGLGGVLVCFAALCALAIAFIWKFLPETKGLPVEEIVRIFEQNPASPGTAPAATAAGRR